jgi:hypothetical protein
MPGLSINDVVDPELAKLPKYGIGDRMRIVKAGIPDNAPAEAKKILRAAIGRVLVIKDIQLWETGKPEAPYHVTYEFHVGHLNGAPNRWAFLESIYMNDDEIAPVRRRYKIVG